MVDVAYAMAQPADGGQSSAWSFLPFMAAMIAIFYFLLIRPQQKERKAREAMLTTLKRGDRVVTTSGLHGTVVGLSDQTVTLKVTDQVRLEFERSAIGRILTAPSEKESGS